MYAFVPRLLCHAHPPRRGARPRRRRAIEANLRDHEVATPRRLQTSGPWSSRPPRGTHTHTPQDSRGGGLGGRARRPSLHGEPRLHADLGGELLARAAQHAPRGPGPVQSTARGRPSNELRLEEAPRATEERLGIGPASRAEQLQQQLLATPTAVGVSGETGRYVFMRRREQSGEGESTPHWPFCLASATRAIQRLRLASATMHGGVCGVCAPAPSAPTSLPRLRAVTTRCHARFPEARPRKRAASRRKVSRPVADPARLVAPRRLTRRHRRPLRCMSRIGRTEDRAS